MALTWHDIIGDLKETDYFKNALNAYDADVQHCLCTTRALQEL